MTAVTPFLWFDGGARAAIEFYTGLLPDSEILELSLYLDEVPGMGGQVMSARFRLAGREYLAMDAGPHARFTEAVSLLVACADQDEVDRYWEALIADGGTAQPCGWVKDRWGLSWQIVPDRLSELIRDPDPARSHRAVQAMLQMQKIDIAALEAAADAE
jgi:predicted 3-demethylubiquinone-9 3-methyltransferase (glyoxalase superfamily)